MAAAAFLVSCLESVVDDTIDDVLLSRQRFLAEQGYSYTITDADDLPTADLEAPDDR